MARVHVDVPALDREFDYLVPEKLIGSVRAGTVVRVPLHGRRVRGWVTAIGVEPPADVRLHPIAKVTGVGPAPAMTELARWAAWRWAGRRTTFLRAASPDRAVAGLPAPARPSPVPAAAVTQPLADEALTHPRTVLRLPPAADRFPVIEAALRRGPALLLTASHSDAVHLAQRLRRAGQPVALMPDDWARAAAGGAAVIGTRAAAWAPAADLSSVVVLDGHDDAHVEERAPTWNAWVVAAERARRAAIPCVVVSPVPTLELLAWGTLLTPSRAEERSGWPALVVVDRRREDPRSGLYSEQLVAALRGGRRAVCVLNRKGRATMLACVACGELAGCSRCGAAMGQGDSGLRCRRCDVERPTICLSCGRERMKQLRVGVTRAREELEALTHTPVGEVTAETDTLPDTRITVGTEAALHRVHAADVVAFLDFDQELLAPRFTAGEHALSLLARAGRVVGGRTRGGLVLVQTRSPRHDVIVAALHADPGHAADADARQRQELGLPPYCAMALVSGDGAEQFASQLTGVDVRGPFDSVWQVRASDHQVLCDALQVADRPQARLRIEVDPRRA